MAEFKKIYGMIPLSLFDELKAGNKFNTGWDPWLQDAIKEKLAREGS